MHQTKHNIARAAESIVEDVDPTHFVTVTLQQARRIPNDGGSASWIKGDDIILAAAYDGFIRALSKNLTSSGSWRRYKRMIRNAMTIEGGRYGERNHLHILMRKPDHMSEDFFRAKLADAASGASWFMQGENAVDVKSLNARSDQISAAIYSMKEGFDRFHITR